MAERPTVRCTRCNLVQYRALNGKCRRCRAYFEACVPEPDSSQQRDTQSEIAGIRASLGPNVRLLRKMAGMSQYELARRCGSNSRPWIAKIETGRITPKLSSIFRIAEIFGVSPLFLIQSTHMARDLQTVRILADSITAALIEVRPPVAFLAAVLEEAQRLSGYRRA